VILGAATASAWVETACREWRTLLLDHANCEKKAASTALALLFAYPDDRALTAPLSRHAREELRHYEQVDRMLERLGVAPARLSPGRYAAELRRGASTTEPLRKLDLLLCGALIEARSCERFELLASRLHAPLGEFYGSLAAAERRHASLYQDLARSVGASIAGDSGAGLVAERLAPLAQRDAALATEPDPQFRFHSGTPAAA
jgi:tRNA-(ms[2]io[6]A)-hydroxylase